MACEIILKDSGEVLYHSDGFFLLRTRAKLTGACWIGCLLDGQPLYSG